MHLHPSSTFDPAPLPELEGLPPYEGGELFINPNIQAQETVSVG